MYAVKTLGRSVVFGWCTGGACGAVSSLAGRQLGRQLQMYVLQEDLLVGRVPGRHALRVVWCHGTYLSSHFVSAHLYLSQIVLNGLFQISASMRGVQKVLLLDILD